ncbi:MAG: translation initiation factor IF-2 subunit beta [Nitrososphaeria archaeon]
MHSDKATVVLSYIELLNKIKDQTRKDASVVTQRLNVPQPDAAVVGNRTVWKNFSIIAAALRRDPRHMMIVIAKELGAAMTIENDGRAVIFGKKDNTSIKNVMNYYIKMYVTCPVCGSPDTKLVKEKKILFLVCEACGARTPVV